MTKVLLRLTHGAHESYHIARPGATTLKGETQLCWVDAADDSIIWTPDGPDSIACETWPLDQLVETYERHWEQSKEAEMQAASKPAVRVAKRYLDNLTGIAKANPGQAFYSKVGKPETRLSVKFDCGAYEYRFGDYTTTHDDALQALVEHAVNGGKEPSVSNVTKS